MVASCYRNRYPLYLAGEFSEGGGDGVGALGEGVHLEHTHGAVPDHRLRKQQMDGRWPSGSVMSGEKKTGRRL